MTDSTTSVVQSNINNIIAIGVSIVMLLILSTILIITATVLIWSYKRRSSKQVNNSSPYSTLNRRAGQPQSLQQDMPELYAQIHSGPSTSQAEYIPKSETANIYNVYINQTLQNSHPTHLTADEEEEGAPQIPPYTITEDLYTEVMKNPYDNPITLDNTEAPPSIPPHTAEELYTNVWMCNCG